MSSARRLIAIGLLVVAASYVYVRRLDYAPAQLGFDEVFFGLQAHSIATTGRDVAGNHLPLYFHFTEKTFFQPMIVYATAATFTVLPVSEVTLRLPTALFALADIVLIFFVAWTIFESAWLAFAAAALLAMTPAHVIHGRMAADYLYPLPFVLAWLLCIASFVRRPRRGLIAAGCAALGVGFYSYLASVVMMPLYIAMTVVIVSATAPRPKWRYLVEIGTFALLMVPVLLWLRAHPTAFVDHMAKYSVYDTRRFSPLQGAKEFLSFLNLTHRIAMYWDYLGPSYLFMHGGVKLAISTRQVGVFLMTFLVLLPVGLYTAMTSRRDWMAWLIAAGFLTAPVAALLVDDPFATDRELTLVPFGVLLATYGVARLWASPRWVIRAATVLLLALSVREFKGFADDYFNDYRERSARYFDDLNMRDGVEAIIASSAGREPAVYLDRDIEDVDSYWRFYVIKHRCPQLLAGTNLFDPATFDARALPSGALVLGRVEDVRFRQPVESGVLHLVRTVRATDGKESLVVMERQPTSG